MILELRRHPTKFFTKVFYKIRKSVWSGKRFIVNYGGSGSSKSESQMQSELINLMKMDCNILIMRKVGADIYDSVYQTLLEWAQKWGIEDLFEWTYSQGKRQILYKKTGRRIIFRGADDIKKIKSIKGVGRVVLEEADAFTFDDFKEINRRIRGFENVQMVFVLNPVDVDHWIKVMFVDQPGTDAPLQGVYHFDTYVIHSTYHDNQFMTQRDIDNLEIMKLVDEYDYEVYCLGKWGRIKTGFEYYPQYSEVIHVRDCPFIEGLPVHLTYDFNAVPFMTLLATQYVETEIEIQIRVFSEYCWSSPLNSVEAVSQGFIDDFEKWIDTVFYYGDAHGTRRIAGKGDERLFDDVRKTLHPYIFNGSDRTLTQNVGVMKRRSLVMKALSGHLFVGTKKVVIIIDESCEKTRADFKNVKIGKNGKLEEKTKDKRTGVEWVKWGHPTDAFEYEFCELFRELL